MKMCEPVNHHYAAELAKAGIRIQIIPNEFNHAKVFIADDYLSCIGSTNLDKLSLKRLYEVNTYIYDEDTALELKALFDKDLSGSYLVTPELSKNWNLGEYLGQAFWVPLDFLL